MSKVFDSIKQGLDETLEFSKGKNAKAVVHEFTSAFGISVSTLRHWERGDRTPQGPALVLLNVVAKEPKAVLKALSH